MTNRETIRLSTETDSKYQHRKVNQNWDKSPEGGVWRPLLSLKA